MWKLSWLSCEMRHQKNGVWGGQSWKQTRWGCWEQGNWKARISITWASYDMDLQRRIRRNGRNMGRKKKKSSLKEKTKNWNNLTRYWTSTVKTRKRLKDHSNTGIRNRKGSESVKDKDVNQRCLFKRKMLFGDTVMSPVSKHQVI